jgi:uncharacterized Rmd1/YagE family protein
LEDGAACVLFSYGVAVFIQLPPERTSSLLDQFQPYMVEPLQTKGTWLGPGEECELFWDGAREGLIAGQVWIREPSLSRLHVVAHVLAKAAVLDHFERVSSTAFDLIEPMAEALERTGSSALSARDLVRQIGRSIGILHKIVGRAEIREKPDVLWENPDLEKLNDWLTDEFELRERELALARKIDLINQTAQTLLDILQTKRGLRVEWYIVALIIFEILLSLFGLSQGLH